MKEKWDEGMENEERPWLCFDVYDENENLIVEDRFDDILYNDQDFV